jgi:hypothetical protein
VHTLRRLDTNGLEQRGVAQRKLDQLANLGELLADATDVIVADIVQTVLVVALDRVALAVNDGIRSNDAIRQRIGLHDLELHSAHTTTHQEEIACSTS